MTVYKCLYFGQTAEYHYIAIGMSYGIDYNKVYFYALPDDQLTIYRNQFLGEMLLESMSWNQIHRGIREYPRVFNGQIRYLFNPLNNELENRKPDINQWLCDILDTQIETELELET